MNDLVINNYYYNILSKIENDRPEFINKSY